MNESSTLVLLFYKGSLSPLLVNKYLIEINLLQSMARIGQFQNSAQNFTAIRLSGFNKIVAAYLINH